MLRIDCLLVNTEVADTVRKVIGYMGHKGIAEDKDVSFSHIYNELRKNGVEVDAETAAHIYASELPVEDARFTSAEDLQYHTGKWFDDMARAITLQKPKRGEKEIGELSPAQAVAKAYAAAFAGNVKSDETTKSILKTFEDFYKEAGKRMLGDMPNDTKKPDTRSAAEIVEGALEKEQMGYRNLKDGSINGLAKMHDEVRRLMSEFTSKMEQAGDHDKAEQWNNYAKSLEDASYTMMFTSNEGRRILHESLMDNGFVKANRSGEPMLDWQKMAGNINSYEQLRKNVIDGLKGQGISEDVAGRVADSMSKEFKEIRGNILEHADRNQKRLKDSWEEGTQKEPRAITDIVQKRIGDWLNLTKFEGRGEEPLKFTPQEANKIAVDALRQSDEYGIDFSGRSRAINWESMVRNPPTKEAMHKIIKDSLKKDHGVTEPHAQLASEAISKDFHETLRQQILEHADRHQQRLKDSWEDAAKKEPRTISDIAEQRVKNWLGLTKFEGRENEALKFTPLEAQKIVTDSLRRTDKYGMDYAADSRAVDWQAMAQDPPTKEALRDMITEGLRKDHGVKDDHAQYASASISEDYHQLLTERIQENSKRLLDNRQAAIDRDSPTRRSALARLGELHDLGVFNGEHDRLLAHVLGIDSDDVEAIRGVENFAKKLSNLRQLLSGNDFIVPSVVHTLNWEIHSILAPIISDKTKKMRIVSALNKIYQVENSMLISTHGNILENHLSGAMELLTTNLSQRLRLGGKLGGFKSQDRQVMADYYAHIAAGGAENGLAPWQVGGTKERVSDKYTVHKMRDQDWSKPSTWAKGMATAVMTIPRTFLSGADAAVKIGLMNSHMKSAVIDALMADNSMSKDNAIQFYNDAIYGEGQLAKATDRAKQVYANIGLPYVSKRELNITANELLRENLITPGGLTPEALEETMKNAYHQAGLGMGHESNNPLSERQQAFKQTLNRKEAQAIANHDWDAASKIRMRNTVLNDVVFRFAASRFNWAWIRAEQAGAGVLTGLYHYSSTNKKYKNIDVLDTDKANEAAVEYQKARQKLFRGMVGLGISAAGYTVTRAIAQATNPNEEDPMEAMFDKLKDNYGARALYLKVAPLWMLQSYEYNEIKNGSPANKALGGLLKDYINLTNIGDAHDFSVQAFDAAKAITTGKTDKQIEKGYATLGSMFNNLIPHVPLVRQGKNIMSFTHWIEGKPASPMPPYPHSFLQGLLGGGVIQDALGTVSDDKLPENLQGWGKEVPQQEVSDIYR